MFGHKIKPMMSIQYFLTYMYYICAHEFERMSLGKQNPSGLKPLPSHRIQAANSLETQPNPPHPMSNIASPMEPPQSTLLGTGTEPSQAGHTLAL